MNTQLANTGNTVVDMRAFDPDMIGSLFTRVEMSWSKDARARFVVSQLGDLSLIRSTHSARGSKSRRLERHIADDDTNYYFACLPLAGEMKISRDGRSRRRASQHVIGSHQIGLLSSTETYEIAMSDELDAIWLRVPEKLLCAHAVSVKESLWRPMDAGSGLGLIAKHMMRDAVMEDVRFKRREARILGHSLVCFLGEIVNTHQGTQAASLSRNQAKILGRARDFIDDHIHEEDLTPVSIADGIGISARYLSEIFAAEGTSPMRWVRSRRLELCRIELERQSGGQQRICEIAYSMGFANVSSFNRAFKAHFGCTPRSVVEHGITG